MGSDSEGRVSSLRSRRKKANVMNNGWVSLQPITAFSWFAPVFTSLTGPCMMCQIAGVFVGVLFAFSIF
jgi:hypothetical protein